MVDAQCGPKTGGVCLCTVRAIPPAVMDQVGNPERLESSPVTASEETPDESESPRILEKRTTSGSSPDREICSMSLGRISCSEYDVLRKLEIRGATFGSQQEC